MKLLQFEFFYKHFLIVSKERRKSDADVMSDLTPDSSEMTLSSRGHSFQ